LVFTASSFKQVQQFDLNKINKLRVKQIGTLLKYAANSGSRANCLLLIRLTQHTPMGSVEGCPGRHFPRICGNSKATSLPKRPAKRTSRLAVGLRVSSVRAAQIGELMSW
jgi:hypothetical protein